MTDIMEILSNGQIELKYRTNTLHPFYKMPVPSPIYVDETYSGRDIRLVGLSQQNEIISNLDNKRIPFETKIHPYIVPFEGSYVALSKNNRDVVNANGKIVATFKRPVEPEILPIEDRSFVSLEKDFLGLRIAATSDISYRPFSRGVWPTLVRGNKDGELHALMDDGHTVLSNLHEESSAKYGSLPRFNVDEINSSEGGRILRIANTFFMLTIDNKIIGTDKVIYGEFDQDMVSESLVFSRNKFIALIQKKYADDGYYNSKNIIFNGKHAEEISYDMGTKKYKTLGEVPRTVKIDVNKLEKILKENK